MLFSGEDGGREHVAMFECDRPETLKCRKDFYKLPGGREFALRFEDGATGDADLDEPP